MAGVAGRKAASERRSGIGKSQLTFHEWVKYFPFVPWRRMIPRFKIFNSQESCPMKQASNSQYLTATTAPGFAVWELSNVGVVDL